MRVSTLKNAFGRTRLTAVLFSLLFVFLVACGDDDNTNNGTSNNGGSNNGGADAGDTNGGGDDGGNDGGGTGEDSGNDAGTDADADNPTCEGLSGLACDPICQTGCADGEACVAGRASANDPLTASCLPEGQGTQGDACGQQAGCAAGFGCFATEQGGDTVCLEICQPSEGEGACGTEGTACSPQDQTLDYGLCTEITNECEQFPPEDTCGEGQNCYQTTAGGTVCADFTADAAAGDACSTPTDCNDLQLCVSESQGGPSSCLDACDPSAETSRCQETETCTALSSGGIGVCVAAQ